MDLVKTCTKCGETKAATSEFFGADKRGKDGLRSKCKGCYAAGMAAYRMANPDRVRADRAYTARSRAAAPEVYRARVNAWAKANAETKRQCDAEYRQANPEKVRAAQAAWTRNNADKLREIKAAYLKANPAKFRVIAASRRAAKSNATPAWLSADQKAQIALVYKEAEILSSRGFLHHVDHIVPLKGEAVSGLHVPWNLRAIPASVNQRKHNKTPAVMPVCFIK